MSTPPSDRRSWLQSLVDTRGGLSAVADALRLPVTKLNAMLQGTRLIDRYVIATAVYTFGPVPSGAPAPAPAAPSVRDLQGKLVEELKALDPNDREIAAVLLHLLANKPETAPRVGALLAMLTRPSDSPR